MLAQLLRHWPPLLFGVAVVLGASLMILRDAGVSSRKVQAAILIGFLLLIGAVIAAGLKTELT